MGRGLLDSLCLSIRAFNHDRLDTGGSARGSLESKHESAAVLRETTPWVFAQWASSAHWRIQGEKDMTGMNQVPQQSPGPMTPPSDSTGLPPTQPPHMPQPQPRAHSVCGILGVVFGAIGFVLSFIPIINNAAIFFGGVGVVLAIIAIVGTFRGKKSGKAVAIIGAVLSILAIVITLNMQASFSKAFNEAGLSTSSSSSNASSDTTNTPTVMDQEGDLKDLHVRIDSAVKSVNDYEDKPTVLVTYQWKNT